MNAARNDERNRELAAIHVAKKQLALDDGTYRDMLFMLTRKRSSAELDQAERRTVIEHLRKRGFTKAEKPAQPAPHDHGRKPIVAADKQGLVDKLEAQLAAAARPWNYVRSMAKRMYRIDQLEWASATQLRGLVAALEYDQRRRKARAHG